MDNTITFNFLGLTTQPLEKDFSIVLVVYLLTKDGAEEDKTDFTCTLKEEVDVKDGQTKQANFKCEKGELDHKDYTGLKLVSSEDIAGIPTDDDTLLNPKLTDDEIAAGLIKNCTADSSVPPIFEVEKVGECDKTGKFSIEGKLSEDKTITSTFTLSLTYPQGILLTCSFVEKNIQCIADNEISEEVIMEQTIVTNGAEELFILSNFTEKMTCSNGLKLQAEEKINVPVSFRQVSHVKKVNNVLSFFFAGFVNSELTTTTTIQINVIVIIGGNNVEKVAKCKLRKDVKPSKGIQIQGDFDCNVELEQNENAEPESLTISENNDNIGGCSDLSTEEASPTLTDKAFENVESASSALSQTIDYSIEENKDIVPPSFEVTDINMDRCAKKGTLTVTGKFSKDIEEEMTFDLPFSFPKTKAKCTVDEAKANEEVQITCKIPKVRKFLKFKHFVIEPRLMKKKCMEMLYIQSVKKELKTEAICESYDEVRKKHAIARRHAPFSFLQMGRPANFGWLFFMALAKKASFTKFSIEITVIIEAGRRRNLQRILDDKEQDKTIDCELSTEAGGSAVVNCGKGEGKAQRLDFIDDNVAGAPENSKVPETDPPGKDDLDKINALPSVTITNITSKECSTTGKYLIEGTSDKTFQTTEKFTIPFSSPDSSGLCSAKVADKKVTINCDNTEEFAAPDFISIDPQLIKYDNGTGIFKIAEDYSVTGFSCVISDDSLKNPFPTKYSLTPGSSSPSGSSSSSSGQKGDGKGSRTNYSKKSSGLGGGAIAGIVIACVVVVAAVIALFALGKSGFFSKSGEVATSIDNTSSINRFNLENKNPNMV